MRNSHPSIIRVALVLGAFAWLAACGGATKVSGDEDTSTDGTEDSASDLVDDSPDDPVGDGVEDPSGDGDDPGIDVPADGVSDADDAVSESGLDVPDDTPVDTIVDTIVDTATDTGMDTGADTATDTGMDTGADTATDTGMDTGPDAPTGVVGDPCTDSTDCSAVPTSSRTCMTDFFGYVTLPGGYCSADCTSGSDCGAGADCVNMFIATMCLKSCTTNADCRTSEGYECAEPPYIGGGPYCLPIMGTTEPPVDGGSDVYPDVLPDLPADIPADIPLDLPGDTTADVVPGPGYVGDACNVDGDCDEYPSASAACMHDFLGFLTLPGGYCSAVCTSGTECGTGGACVDLMGTSYCIETCASAGDCRVSEGYSCSTIPLAGITGTYCVPF